MAPEAVSAHTDTLSQDQRRLEQALDVVVRWSQYQFYARVMEKSGIAIDRSTISILNRHFVVGTLRVSDLADYLGLDRSTVSRQVSTAVNAGYLEKLPDENDSRAYQLKMTELGREAILSVRKSWDVLISDLTSYMTEEETAEVARVLPILSRAVEDLTAEAPSRVPGVSNAGRTARSMTRGGELGASPIVN